MVALLDGWLERGHGPLPRRLASSLRHLLDAGVLAPGWQLPPERTLARRLGVSRTTVTQALDELRCIGLLESSQGRGTFVVGPDVTRPPGTRIIEHLASGPGIDLAKGDAPDLSHLPEIALEMWQLAAHVGGAAVHAAGLDAMRAAVADLHCRGGVTGRPRTTDPAQIHVTAGSHQATSLLLTTLAPPGARVAVAEWSYAGLFDILDQCELQPVGVPLDRHGLDPDALRDVILRHRPAVMYFQAGPQIPTGQCSPAHRISEIARVVDDYDLTVIEDTTVASTTFTTPATMLADTCTLATVVTTGSLSKLCFSGLRIGWIRGPHHIVSDTTHRHLGHDLGASTPSQILALQLLPHLDHIAEQRRQRLDERVTAALDQLALVLPDALIEPPAGNSILWARTPLDDSTDFVDLARRHGVRIAPGSIHHPKRATTPYVRIDVDRPKPITEEGIDRLGTAWRSRPTPGQLIVPIGLMNARGTNGRRTPH